MTHSNTVNTESVAVVTGAGRGVGRATALALAAARHPVGLISRTTAELDVTRDEIVSRGGTAVVAAADVRDAAALDAAFGEIETAFGAVGLLVTMAGTAQAIGPSWKVDDIAWWTDVETNLRGTFLACRRALPAMIEAGDGRIVTVSTYALDRPTPYLSGYVAAKAGVASFAASLSAEVGPHGVKVFLMTPGTVRTDMFEHLATSAEGRRWLPELATRGETLAPEDGARLVVRLASGEADALAGRFVHALDDLDNLLTRTDEIKAEDAYVLRLRRL